MKVGDVAIWINRYNSSNMTLLEVYEPIGHMLHNHVYGAVLESSDPEVLVGQRYWFPKKEMIMLCVSKVDKL